MPTCSRSLTAVTVAMAMNGSSVRRYSSANSSSPVGAGVWRDTGMWVCSGNQIEA